MEEIPLYNGEVVLSYDPAKHAYRVNLNGKSYKVPSVTQALGVINKPALIPWAVNNAIGVIRGAVMPGTEHSETILEAIYGQAKKESGRIKQSAANVGTEVHRVLEQFIRTGTIESDLQGEVASGVCAGVDWLSSQDIQWVGQEVAIYSRRHKYSGRLDGIAKIGGLYTLLDWKTSKGIYPEYRLQTAAYVHAYEEEHPTERIEQRVLIRLGKEDGAFEPHVYPRKDQRKDFGAFLGALRLYTHLNEIEKEEKLRHKKQLIAV